jgi:Ca2+-transporting ATPase
MKDAKQTNTFWHTIEEGKVFEQLKTSTGGLAQVEAKKRLDEYGLNQLQASKRISPLKILAEQFKNVLIVILLVATILSAFLGHGLEAIVITVIVLFAVILGFLQEYRAEQALEALRKMAAPEATVIRDGKENKIPAVEVVPGDLIILRAGDKVPADLRLIEAVNLQANEAPLTGESMPVTKTTTALKTQNLPAGDRTNLAFAGTAVTYGRGSGIVVATAMGTEFGKIASLLEGVETTRTPLQENLDKLGHTLAKGALVLVALVVGLGLFRGQPFVEMFVFGVSLAVAVVPEALPAVVTISLAIGVKRMVKRHALIRRLPAVETLGSTTVICSDKTGTLTKDEMTVRKIFIAGELLDVTGAGYGPKGEFLKSNSAFEPSDHLKKLLLGGVLASDAHIEAGDTNGTWQMKGDPTEGALVAAAAKAGIHKREMDKQFPRVHEIPFTSETKRMTTMHKHGDMHIAYSKGAAEIILSSCKSLLTPEGEKPLDEKAKQAINDAARSMAEGALRVLGVSYKPEAAKEGADKDHVFLGLVGMIDPPRAEAKAAIETCKQAGIKVIMITGDHPITATAIAKELGILTDGKIITGPELDALSDQDFEKEVQNIQVYARVSPEHKLKVVGALQKKGHVVAMTGDGVNDAPALKKADIGVAMGITGADVTKEAGAMTLTDDNFASIVAAVEEGRGIFGNIKKYLMYLLSSNTGEIALILGSSLLGMPLPLTAVQILYVNLATDGLPALALAVDPPQENIMNKKPRKAGNGIFTKPVIWLIVTGGLWSALINLSLFAWARSSGRGLTEAMTMTFVSLVLIQFFKAYNFRAPDASAFHKPFRNKWLNMAVLWELILLLCVIYIPFLHEPFSTFSLTLKDWIIILSLAITVIPAIEIAKLLIKRKFGDSE